MMSDTQRYAKTPRAWEALARPDLVGRRAHTLLLMANGRRSVQALSRLLGEDIAELAQNLQQRGLLQDLDIAFMDEVEEDSVARA